MTFKLEARRRVSTGKGAGRRIRSNGLVPAVLYGGDKEPVNLALEPKAVKQILLSAKGGNTTFTLEVNGGETVDMARIVEFQKHPVRRTLVHCDIQRLDPQSPLKFKVPIRLEGVGPAQKMGCKIRHVTRDVVVRCKPGEVPEAIVVRTTRLRAGGTIRLADVTSPEGVELLFRDNAPIVTASAGPAGVMEEDEDEDEEGAATEGGEASEAESEAE